MTTLLCRLLIALSHAMVVGRSLAAVRDRGMYAVITSGWPSPAQVFMPGSRSTRDGNMMTGVTAGARRCRARVLVALACALAAGIAAADGAPRGQFAAWAIGLPDGYVMMEYQAPVIHVTADDVARGVVEVRGGSRLVITTRSPAGYAVDFYTNGKLFQAVEIDGIGNAVALGTTGGTVVQQQAAAGRHVVALNYRFVLTPGTAPGTYAWPLELAVRGTGTRDLQHLAGEHRNTMLGGRTEP